MRAVHVSAVRAGVRIELVTVIWMVIDAAISLGASLVAGSALIDRVLMAEGKPRVYGTQYVGAEGGGVEPWPIPGARRRGGVDGGVDGPGRQLAWAAPD